MGDRYGEEGKLVIAHGYDSYNQSVHEEVAQTLKSNKGGDDVPRVLVLESNQNHATAKETEVCTCLPASMGMGGGYVPMVVGFCDDPTIKVDENEVGFALRSRDYKGVQCVSYQNVTGPLMASGYDKLGTQEAMSGMYVTESKYWNGTDVCDTLTERNAGGAQRMPDKQNFTCVIDESSEADTQERGGVELTSVVRRLTPTECERLQGMPDEWSKYGINEKGEVYELPDSARYKIQGNGICTPFWRWLMKRISAQYERTPTLGSLFDGQASFPMIWEGINGPGTAVWSSEIEKHAIAVAKYHFPEE